jgi:hypothetical protein
MEGYKEIIKYPEGKYRTAILDTINGLQNRLYNRYLAEEGKANFDKWRDFGVEIFQLYDSIKALPDTVMVQILGYEGTGKTIGGSYLNPDTNAWANSDGKPLSFFGARAKYPTDNSKKNYKEVTSYDEAWKMIKAIHEKRLGTFIVFTLGHIADYNSADGQRQRLKVLGKQATNLGVEGLNFIHTYYTKVDANLPADDPKRYQLTTVNSGLNTARSPQGYWNTPTILNNYQTIVDKILLDYGELEPIS